jgi:hypothetical protein
MCLAWDRAVGIMKESDYPCWLSPKDLYIVQALVKEPDLSTVEKMKISFPTMKNLALAIS